MPSISTITMMIWTVFYMPSDHAVYISVVEFQENSVRIKVFTDDLQDAIRNDSPGSFQPGNISDFCNLNQSAIEKYFQNKLKIVINNSPVAIKYLKSRVEGDSYWINFTMNFSGSWKSLNISAPFFRELFPTQSNIIKVMGSKPRFCKITAGNPQCSFEF